jgi:hypothetical protein
MIHLKSRLEIMSNTKTLMGDDDDDTKTTMMLIK